MGRVRTVLLVACIACLAALIGCSSGRSAGNGASAALDEQLAAIAQGDAQVVSEYLEAGMFDPQDFGVSVEAFTECYFEGFTYEIGDSVAHDDFTAVDVTLSVRDQAQMLACLEEARDAALEEGADASEAGFADSQFCKLYEQNTWERHSVGATVPMRQDSETGEWLVVDRGSLCASLLDGYDMRQILS